MEAAVRQPLPAQAAMPKRCRELFFHNPARRPRTGPIGLDSLPPTLIEQVLSYIYPEECLDQGRPGALDRMAGRMFGGFAHNHEVMVLGRQAMDVLTVSGSLGDAMFWNYRVRLRTFQNELHERFLAECLDHLVHTSRGPVPPHEIRSLQARKKRCHGRESMLEQVLLRPMVRSFGRRYCSWQLEREAGLNHMTSKPLPLARRKLVGEEVVV